MIELDPGHYPAPLHLLKYFPYGIPPELMYNPDFVYGILYPKSFLNESNLNEIEDEIMNYGLHDILNRKIDSLYLEKMGFEGKVQLPSPIKNRPLYDNSKEFRFSNRNLGTVTKSGNESHERLRMDNENNQNFGVLKFNSGKSDDCDSNKAPQLPHLIQRRRQENKIKLYRKNIDGIY